MKKKGFTLIELLAVIVVLAIIAIIAVPQILNVVEKARRSAAEVSALGYIDAVEKQIIINQVKGENLINDGTYQISEKEYSSEISFLNLIDSVKALETTNENIYLNNIVNFKGSYPTSGYLTITNGKVKNGIIIIQSYEIEYDSTKVKPVKILKESSSTIDNEICEYEINQTFDYDYKDENQTFIPKCKGKYKLEVWGAQGGTYNTTYYGGYGGYSVGVTNLNKNETLYINIGGKGTTSTGTADGGYNGGGNSKGSYGTYGSGGGATHIAKVSGTLQNLSQYKGNLILDSYYDSNEILIAAGGGGGSIYYYDTKNYNGYGSGGSGGGYIGAAGIYNTHKWKEASYCGLADGGNQIAYGLASSITVQTYCMTDNEDSNFGLGASANNDGGHTGGGGGFFGGGTGYYAPASGGSGYIASSKLISTALVVKHMYCFNCKTSTEENTKTDSDGTNSCHNSIATADCAKENDGFARITYLGN